MKLYLEAALIVCLCLWIPVAQSYGAPEDQDGSGDDDEFSGSGSGDDDIWFIEPEMTTQESPNPTNTAWMTDAAVSHPGPSATQSGMADPEPEIYGNLTETTLLYTTPITETQPSPVFVDWIGSKENKESESTTVSNVEGAETSVPPVEKLPVIPTHEEEYTVPASDMESTTESPVVDQGEDESAVPVEAYTVTAPDMESTTESPVVDQGEDESAVPVEAYTVTASDKESTTETPVIDQEEEEYTVPVEAVPEMTETPEMDTTPLLIRTTSASNSFDSEASGDVVESTTVEDIADNFIEKIIIPEHRQPKKVEPEVVENDFDFDNEIRTPLTKAERPGSESDFARGSSSDSDNLLERKEVLAGVIACGVVGLAFAIMLVALMVYRMKKKDEGSYSLDDHKHPNGGYQKPLKQEEFLA